VRRLEWIGLNVTFGSLVATAWIVYEFQAAALVAAALVIGYVEGRSRWL
jgi:hypothetical protein